MQKGIIVDVETTGLNPKEDVIIEIGLLQFSYDSTGDLNILTTYGALQDTEKNISSEITKLTGISKEMLKGESINWSFVKSLLSSSSIVIAHNMPFDRSFLLEKPELSDLDVHWACSQKHINWNQKGFRSKALNYLACDKGFVNPFSHRAIFDCATTFRVIESHWLEIFSRSQQKEYCFSAIGAPFETKDLLKANGYKWNVANRVWFKRSF